MINADYAGRSSTATARCVVPGCGATRGLHAHHIWHWEDGGPTDSTTSRWSARITTGCTIAASSPSPDPPTTSSSPTVMVNDSAGITGPPTDQTPAERHAVSRTDR